LKKQFHAHIGQSVDRLKKVLLWTAVLFLLCAGCTFRPDSSASEADTGSKLDNIPFFEHHSYAVAHLGYQEVANLDFYLERYLDSDPIPTYYLSDGDFHLIIPRYPGTSLSLYQNNLENGSSTLMIHDPDCRPFILQCNVSDIFADATIRLTYGDESVEFSPFISLKNGAIDIGENGLDITKQG